MQSSSTPAHRQISTAIAKHTAPEPTPTFLTFLPQLIHPMQGLFSFQPMQLQW